MESLLKGLSGNAWPTLSRCAVVDGAGVCWTDDCSSLYAISFRIDLLLALPAVPTLGGSGRWVRSGGSWNMVSKAWALHSPSDFQLGFQNRTLNRAVFASLIGT